MASIRAKVALAGVAGLFIGAAFAALSVHYFAAPAPSDAPAAPAERKVLFWYDPMYPNTKFDKPGPSPFMDMDLVPKYAEDDDAELKPGIRIDPAQTQNLGLTTAQARFGQLDYSQSIPANVDFNEYQYAIVQSRADGFIDKVYPLTVGDRVTAGTPLLELTVPAWVEAQSEYLLLSRGGAGLTQYGGALERLRLSGMPPEDIERLKATKTLQTRFVIKAPIDGVITAFDLRTGMNISKDAAVAKIQGINPVWINASVPEALADLFSGSPRLSVTVPALPDGHFQAQKWDVLSNADPVTRTLKLRLQVDNPQERLKPGMNAFITLTAQSQKMLLIPAQAVIDDGVEQRVIVLNNEGRFVPKRITLYRESRGQAAVSSGLEEGESVVVSGLFLIDSEANISGALERMRQRPQDQTSDAASAHAAH